MTTVPTVILAATDDSQSLSSPAPTFVERRKSDDRASAFERRQFGNSHATLSPDARQLAEAIDAYKVEHHRRYITFEEMLKVIRALGYQKQ